MIKTNIVLTFVTLLSTCIVSNTQENTTEAATKCREHDRLITTDKGDLYLLTEAILGEKLTLQCHYCAEEADDRAKVWYEVDKLGITQPHEVNIDMNNNASANRVYISNDNSLIIDNFTYNDTGLYYCVNFEEQTVEEKFNYLVDLAYPANASSVETGDLTAWKSYYEDYFKPVNELLSESEGDEFVYLRRELNVTMELVTRWEPWSSCEVCGRPKGEGVRKRKGLCRLKIASGNSQGVMDEDEVFLVNANIIGCGSMVLERLVPGVSNLTKIIPDFTLTEACEGTCNPDAEGAQSGWKVGKSKGYKYRKTFVLAENSHLTVVCPEATLDSVVKWRKNGKELEAGGGGEIEEGDSEPRVLLDTFNTLYLIGVKESEEGNYTCQVDDVQMQQIRVFVVTKRKLLTQALARHMLYLGFVLSLTLSCYVAGLIMACSKRHTFKSYERLIEEKDDEYDDDISL